MTGCKLSQAQELFEKLNSKPFSKELQMNKPHATFPSSADPAKTQAENIDGPEDTKEAAGAEIEKLRNRFDTVLNELEGLTYYEIIHDLHRLDYLVSGMERDVREGARNRFWNSTQHAIV